MRMKIISFLVIVLTMNFLPINYYTDLFFTVNLFTITPLISWHFTSVNFFLNSNETNMESSMEVNRIICFFHLTFILPFPWWFLLIISPSFFQVHFFYPCISNCLSLKSMHSACVLMFFHPSFKLLFLSISRSNWMLASKILTCRKLVQCA